MPNFNNSRSIDIEGYLPEIFRNIREFRAIAAAETPEVTDLWETLEEVFDDQFLNEATENGIARRERMLGIVPSATDTLDSRRFRLKTMYGEALPYTRRSLEAQLRELCGGNGYALDFETGSFTVSVKVALSVRSQVNAVAEMLERVLPYNMVFSVALMYNQWHQLTPKIWNEYKKLTWKSIKEDLF